MADELVEEEISEEELLVYMVGKDWEVKLPPKKRYSIELEITNIRRGKPSISGDRKGV